MALVALAIVLLPCAAYLLASHLALAFAERNRTQLRLDAALEVYALDNGVHIDLLVPARAGQVDWLHVFPPPSTVVAHAVRYVAIGWGDRDFYLNTPTWRDLDPMSALGALVGGRATVLHVAYLVRRPRGEGVYRARVAASDYRELARFVGATAALDGTGAARFVAPGYGASDAFFAANRSYNLLYTCNVWAGQALRGARAKVSPWTPFSYQVRWFLESDSRGAAPAHR